MLDKRQVAILCGTGAVFWLADAFWIRSLPALAVGPLWGDVAFLLSVPVAWLCVRLARALAGLGSERIIAGVALMVLVAALLHGAALRWYPDLYGSDHAGRLGGAWLLWIYGLIFGCALLATVPRHSGGDRVTGKRSMVS